MGAENRVNGMAEPRFRTPDWRFQVVRFQRRNHRLTVTARGLVLPVIAEWTRPTTGLACIGQKQIAEEAGISDARVVRRAQRDLRVAGVIDVARRGRKGRTQLLRLNPEAASERFCRNQETSYSERSIQYADRTEGSDCVPTGIDHRSKKEDSAVLYHRSASAERVVELWTETRLRHPGMDTPALEEAEQLCEIFGGTLVEEIASELAAEMVEHEPGFAGSFRGLLAYRLEDASS